MGRLKDNRGVSHKHYSNLVIAERRYAAEDKAKAKLEAAAKVVPSVEPKVEPPKAKEAAKTPAPTVEPSVTDDIIIEDARERDAKAKEAAKTPAPTSTQEYYCLNCGETVNKGDAICPSCGIELSWGGIE